MARLEFWYDLASNYSYLSAMRIEGLAAAAGIEVAWRPFLLGPIFKAQGWDTSPFNLYPAKGRNMLRDMERITAERGLPFVVPAPFPARSLTAVRVAHAGEAEGFTGAFTKAAFAAEFGRGADIAEPAVLSEILRSIGRDPAAVLEWASSAAVKDGLKARTAEAQARGIYGAPSFVTTDGELFWGDDRLEQALRWAGRTA
jgi:2-hydroxychromene-2-carboxylate isomerase